jgi:hypothetical protein
MKSLAVTVAGILCLWSCAFAVTPQVSAKRVEQATDARPLLVFFADQNSCALCPDYENNVLKNPDFLRFLNRNGVSQMWVIFEQTPYYNPNVTLLSSHREKLDLARQFDLDVANKGRANPDDFPSLFLVTGFGKKTRLKINLQKMAAEPKRLVEDLANALLPFPDPPLAAVPAPGMIVAYSPHMGFAWDRATTPPQVFAHANPAAKATDPGIGALAIGRNGQQFFAPTASRPGRATPLCRSDRTTNEVLFTPPAPGGDVDPVICDIELDDADEVYFSQVRGGAGKIFHLVHDAPAAKWRPEIVYTSRVADLPQWNGRFSFGRLENGAMDMNMLYLIADGAIHRVWRKDGVWLTPQKLALPQRLIADSIRVTGPAEAFLTSGRQLVQMMSWVAWKAALTLPTEVHGVSVAH